MKINKSNIYFLGILFIVLLANLLYIFVFRDLVYQVYKGQSPAWFNSLINILYPRFTVEKHRFDYSFFIAKADQVIIRLCLVSMLTTSILMLKTRSEKICIIINNYWKQSVTISSISILRILYFSFLLLIFKDIYWDLLSISKAKEFYRPILLYQALNIPFPSEIAILFLYITLLISCLATIVNIRTVFFSTIAILNFLLIQGYIFSFEKFDHGFATFSYAGILMPFLLSHASRTKKKCSLIMNDWVLPLIRVLICLCYLFSGLEKLLISGFEWIKPESIQAHLLIHETPLGLGVASSDLLCILFASGTILFQLGFISILFYPRLRWIFLPAGIAFHIATYLLLDVGGYLNPWILAYIFFIDWDHLKSFLLKTFQK